MTVTNIGVQHPSTALRRSNGLSAIASLRHHWPEYLMEDTADQQLRNQRCHTQSQRNRFSAAPQKGRMLPSGRSLRRPLQALRTFKRKWARRVLKPISWRRQQSECGDVVLSTVGHSPTSAKVVRKYFL